MMPRTIFDMYVNGDRRLVGVWEQDEGFRVAVADGDGNEVSAVGAFESEAAMLAALPAMLLLAADEARREADAWSRRRDSYVLRQLPGGLNWFRGDVAQAAKGAGR